MLNPVEGQGPVDVTLRLDQDTIMILLESGYADFIDFLTENGYLSVWHIPLDIELTNIKD